MKKNEDLSLPELDQETIDLHNIVSNDDTHSATRTQETDSSAELVEDGFDIETHGGGRLEYVQGFDSSAAMTNGLAVQDQNNASLYTYLPPAYEGEDEQPESVCGPDDRVRVNATAAIPWRMVCQLIITRSDGSPSGGTGWFIGPRTIMTAGHCVYKHDAGGWAQRIEVIPGLNGTLQPFGSAVGTSFRSVIGWIDEHKPEYDYGCIILPDDTLGNRVGWFGFAALSDNSLNRLLVNNCGYAQDKPMGTQWFNAGRITDINSQRLFYMLDTFNRHSGSPIWRYRNEKRHAVGVHAYGGCPNKATRITKPVFDNMRTWKSV
ncbi:MAG: serine protease [Chloroflexota bacterium]